MAPNDATDLGLAVLETPSEGLEVQLGAVTAHS